MPIPCLHRIIGRSPPATPWAQGPGIYLPFLKQGMSRRMTLSPNIDSSAFDPTLNPSLAWVC